MMISGELVKDKIIIQKPKEVGRLFNKSHFGKTLKDNKLELDLMEGCFLLSEEKIKIFEKKQEKNFEDLFLFASEKNKDFDVKYLVFKDLRKRGHAVKLYDEIEGIVFYNLEQSFFVSVFSEKRIFNARETVELVNKIAEKGSLWFAVVDEEGDVTYYDVSLADLKGSNKAKKYDKKDGLLLDNRVVVFDEVLQKSLFDDEFFGKPLDSGLQLSYIEGLYLFDKKIIDIKDANKKTVSRSIFLKKFKHLEPDFDNRYLVYCDLKNRSLIVKTGFKFGVFFRAYTKNPNKVHAEYLVHVIDKDFTSVWSEMSRAIRLAHSVNKEIVFACVEKDFIEYIGFGRLRP